MINYYKFFSLISVLFFFIPGIALAGDTGEYAVKAVFTLNFARYTTWPEQSFSDTSSPCILCVMGKKDTSWPAFKAVEGEKISNRKLEVRFYESPGDAEECQIIFISRAVAEPDMVKALENVKGKPVMTIGETKKFFQRGGMIHFFNRNERLIFGVNLDIVRQQKIKLSSRLLKLSILTGGK